MRTLPISCLFDCDIIVIINVLLHIASCHLCGILAGQVFWKSSVFSLWNWGRDEHNKHCGMLITSLFICVTECNFVAYKLEECWIPKHYLLSVMLHYSSGGCRIELFAVFAIKSFVLRFCNFLFMTVNLFGNVAQVQVQCKSSCLGCCPMKPFQKPWILY